MSRADALARDVLQTAFRLLPWPTEPRLLRSGTPGPESPVLVTCNYDLTVRRLLRALDGVDAWVVVASSRGINVWCAAAGGEFGTHQVVTALKTSGVDRHVDHRRAILPQLAATGVERREVRRRAGWSVRFGPVDARDLRGYLESGEAGEGMRRVAFPPTARFEMAAAWAAPTSLLGAGAAAVVQPSWIPFVVLVTWLLAFVVFFLYERVPEPRRLMLALAAAVGGGSAIALLGGGPGSVGIAAAVAALIAAIVTLDYRGSTPVLGPVYFEESGFRITLDRDLCTGVFACLGVCPERVFERRAGERTIDLARGESCIRCGACIVQCPRDALHFENASGERIEPDVVRRYKLNLLGRRRVDAGTGA